MKVKQLRQFLLGVHDDVEILISTKGIGFENALDADVFGVESIYKDLDNEMIIWIDAEPHELPQVPNPASQG